MNIGSRGIARGGWRGSLPGAIPYIFFGVVNTFYHLLWRVGGNNLYYVGAETGNKLSVCPRYDYVTDYNLRIHNSITWHWTKV